MNPIGYLLVISSLLRVLISSKSALTVNNIVLFAVLFWDIDDSGLHWTILWLSCASLRQIRLKTCYLDYSHTRELMNLKSSVFSYQAGNRSTLLY